jgi:glutamate racemase
MTTPPPAPTPQLPPAVPRVGVFDSGVGGLGVLRALRQALPQADFSYVADSAWAPYGERDERVLVERASHIAAFLRMDGADALVIACNTATAAAIDVLRADHPSWPIVGIEPAVKPATALTRTGHVGVLATEATLSSARLRRLVRTHANGVEVHLQACPGLADAIEDGDFEAPSVRALVQRHCDPLRRAGCDVVVLGCTHYPFVAPQIAAALGPGVTLLDPAVAVARRAASLLAAAPGRQGRLSIRTTGDAHRLEAFARRHFDAAVRVEPLTL